MSPSSTSIGMTSPVSRLRSPGPAATTVPRCGFSSAVSGRTIPPTVVCSSSRGSTIRRSPSGFRFTWEGERVFKVVSFFLVRYESGKLGEIPEAFRHEVEEVRWLRLDEAPRVLAYQGERRMAEKALAVLAGHEQI